MKFGIFDHMDRAGSDLGRQFDERLRLIALYERAGFHAYHLAEHHATPLGMAPSPSVFLAAVAQRTTRLRFGPLVWPMPLHHPAAADRGNLHARPVERRAPRDRLGAAPRRSSSNTT